MTSIIMALVLILLSTLTLYILSAYNYLSVNEYKRRARNSDDSARSIYQVLLYGKQVNFLFWLTSGILSAVALNLLFNLLPVWIVIILFGFYAAYFHGTIHFKKSNFGLSLAKTIAPAVARILNFIQPVLGRIIAIDKQSMIQQKIYEVDDLLGFLKEQRESLHNRIDADVLGNAIEAVLFKDKVVKDCMTQLTDIASVNVDEDIGPILMEELHDCGYSYFPVYKGKKDHFVGGLYLSDILSVKKGGQVKDYVKNKIYYVHEDSNLDTVISAIIKTNQNKFMVINDAKKTVGLISAGDVFKQIIGAINPSELESYENPDDVITQFNQKDR